MPSKKAVITYHDNVVQGTAEWLLWRKGKFTGSNAYKLLTSFGAGTWSMSADSSFTGNFATERGHILEDEAIDLYEQIRAVKVHTTGFVTNSLYKDCLYSPDGYTDDKTIEVKCFAPENHLKLIKNPDIKVLAQVHFGQLILDKKSTDLIAYCPQPKDWDEEISGKWPVPVEKMLVIIPIKKDRDILNNFKRILKEYYDKKRP